MKPSPGREAAEAIKSLARVLGVKLGRGESNTQLVAFGRAVRELRAEQNITAGELAAAAGLTPGRLDAIEAGRLDLRYDAMLALARGLRVEPAELANRADREGARLALEAYARRRAENAGDTAIVAELAGLIDRAKAAGLDEDTIDTLAAGGLTLHTGDQDGGDEHDEA